MPIAQSPDKSIMYRYLAIIFPVDQNNVSTAYFSEPLLEDIRKVVSHYSNQQFTIKVYDCYNDMEVVTL